MISMRRMRKVFGVTMALMFILGFIASAPPWAHAQIPRYINYQGKLLDAEDNPVTGDVGITLRIYDAETGGTALWTETQTATVTRGIFSILLGNTTALDDLDFNSAYWYSVEVESDGEMTPRQRLTAVAYAINADKLDGYDASDFLAIDTSEGSTTGITVEGGLITAGANEDIELNPTGIGNVIITIDSTSGDFKITDGTTNFVVVDNETGNVTITNDLTVSGMIYGTLSSQTGSNAFTNIVVTGTSDLQGNISDSGGALTIADALTQTGSTNQVTFAGNVDANSGVDVTGALTVSGATTLSSGLYMNANIDLDYSGSSAALDVNQDSTGAAAQFTGAKVLIGADTSNANALSAGELYVQGDLEVDGTIYGDIETSGARTFGDTTLDSLTVTGTSDLQGNVSDSGGDLTIADNVVVTGTADLQGNVSDSAGTYTIADDIDITPTALTSGGTDDYALSIAQTLNDTEAAGGSDTYRAIKVDVTETDKTGWDNVYLMDLQVGGTSEFLIADSGNITAGGTLNMSSNKITNLATPTADTDAATKAYADGIEPSVGGGWSEVGSAVYVTETADNVGIGTTNPGSYKLNVSGATNTTSLYINGALVSSSDLSDGGSIAMLGANSTITGNWVNTDNPWADNEVVDALTIDGGTIDNSVIGGSTAAAGTFTTLAANSGLTLSGTDSFTAMTFNDGASSDTLTYDSTADQELYFSGSMSAVDFHVRGSSPAVLSFGSGTSTTSLIYDPATDEIRFSRGTFMQSTRNLARNASFEAFSAFEQFHAYDPNYATDSAYTDYAWDTAAGYQGGWQDFAPDDWTYVSGSVFQHSPVFFKTNFIEANITEANWNQDFAEGVSAVRLEVDTAANPGKISQVIKRKRLKPSTVYSVGVKMRVDTILVDGVETPNGTARVDILGEDGGNGDMALDTNTTLSSNIIASDKIIPVASVDGFPAFGTIKITDGTNTERIRYEGLDDAQGANKFLKCTRAGTSYSFNSSNSTITVAPFTPLTTSTHTIYKKFEGQFATDPKATEVTIVLSAESGAVFFDTVQIIAGGTVPDYAPAPVVDTGDQTLYGSLRIGRASDEKGGILSVDKFVRTRGVELFTDDPGMTGTAGGGMTTMGGGGIFPPGPGWNPVAQQQPTVSLYVSGTYSAGAPPFRDYKVVIDSDSATNGKGVDTFAWYYMDDITGWNYTGDGSWATGNTLVNCTTDANGVALTGALADDLKIAFSSTTTGVVGDEWVFSASNETHMDDFSYEQNATYVPGRTRIYVDPDPFSQYFNQLVFEDGLTKVSLSELAGTVGTPAYFTNPSTLIRQGTLTMTTSGVYSGSDDIKYEVAISTEGSGATPDSFYYRIYSNNVWGAWSAETVISGNQQSIGNGLYVTFQEPNFNFLNGVVGDKWAFNAYKAVNASSVATHTHIDAASGGELGAPGTTATSFSIGKDTDAATSDISLKFGSAVSEKIIKWDQVNARFNVGGHMNIGGTLTADSITGVAATSHTHLAADLPANTSFLSNTIESAEITDGTIVDADIAADAAIAGTKISPSFGTQAIQTGAEGGDGQLILYSEQGATDYQATLNPNASMASAANFYLPADEPAATYILNMGTDGVIGYDTNTYLTGNQNISLTGDVTGSGATSIATTISADSVGDTMIDWGIGANQVSTDDVTEGTANLYYTDARVDTQLDTDQTISGNWTFSNNVIVPQTPTSGTHAASKAYVDAGIAGLSWKEAALDYVTDNTIAPLTEVSGNRYVLAKDGGIPHAGWDGASAGDMVEFDGASWDATTPADGDAVFIEDVDTGYVYTGTAWTPFTGAAAYTWGDGLSNTSGTTIDVLVGNGIQITADAVTAKESEIDHDLLKNFLADEHIDWTAASDDLATTGAGSFIGNVGIGISAPTALLHVGDATNNIKITSAGAMTFAGTGDIDLPDDSVDTADVNFNYVASVATSSPLSGGAVGSEGTAISLSIADAKADGSTKGAATFTAADFNATSGNISIDYANAQAASAIAKGFLTSADWSTFDGKEDVLTFSTGLTRLVDTITTNDSEIEHDNLSGFVANEHIDWTAASSNLSTTGTGQFGSALTVASTTPSDLILDNTTVGTPAGGDLASDSGKIILRGNFFNDTTDVDTELDMAMMMDVTNASTYKLSIFDNTGTNEIASLDQAGALQIDGDLTLGTIALSATGAQASEAGASKVGVYQAELANSSSTNVQDVLDDLDAAIGVAGTEQNLWATISADTGSATADTATDTLTVAGAGIASTAIVGDTLTITATEADTLQAVAARGATYTGGVSLATVSGNVGIGTTAPSEKLDVNGDIIADHINLRGSSPATITFGSGATARNLQFDPDTGEFEFSGGKLKQQFYNIIRNGSFESAETVGWQMAAGTYGTDVTLVNNASIAKFGSKVISMSDTSLTEAIGSKFTLKNDDLDRLKGNKATISTWARTNAGTQGRAAIAITDGVTTEVQNIPADANPQTYLTTTWQQFIYTFDVDASATELTIFVYAAKDTGDNTAMAVATKTNTDDANVTAIYYDGVTLVEGAMALDYGPSPIVDTGSQVIYGSLAIGANYNPYSTDASNYYDSPRLIFGQPDSYFGGGYGGYSSGSGEIRFMKWDSSSAGMFMFNRGVWLRDDYSSTYGATLRVGDSPSSDYANSRGDAYIKGRLELDGYPSGASASSPTLIVGDPTNAGQSINFADGGNYTRMGDVYISDRLEVDGGIYGNGANITNVSATNVSGSFSSIYSTGDVTINQNSVVTDDVYFAVQHNTSNVFAVDKDGDVTIGGNLQVDGTQTILNVETVEVESSSIVMNRNVTSNPSLNASIIANRGTTAGVDRDLRWNESGDVWDLTPDGTNYYAILHANSSSGGDVSGAFGNLQLGADSVGAAELSATAIQSGDIEAGDLPTLINATKIADGSVTNVEFQYLGSVTSDIQSQFTGKQATITGGAASITSANLSSNRALVSNGSGKVAVSPVTSVELGHLDGVTSAIQAQIDSKSAASDTLTGLVRSTTTGANYITGGKLGIGLSAPTADLMVKGNLSAALAGTVSVTINTAAVTGVGTVFDTELAVGDAIKIGNEIFTVSAIGSATSLTLDSNHTAGASGVTAYKDSDLLQVKDGNDVALMTLDKGGNLTVEGTINAAVEGTSSNANLLDNIDSSSFLRSDVDDSVTTGTTLNIDSGATLSIDGTLDLGGTAITPTAAEINILSGGLTSAELDSNLLTASEGDSAYVNVTGDTMTGNLTLTSADMSIDAGQKLNVEGSTGDSYMRYNAANGRLEVYVNGEVVAYMQN